MKWVHDHNPAVHYCYCQIVPRTQLDGVEAAIKYMVEHESDVQRGGFGCDNLIIARGVDPDEFFSEDVTNRAVIIRIFNTCRLSQIKNPNFRRANTLKIALQQAFCAPKTNFVILFEYAHFMFDMIRYMITQESHPERAHFEFPPDSNWFACTYASLHLPFLNESGISHIFDSCTDINKERVEQSFIKWIKAIVLETGHKFAEFLTNYAEENFLTTSWQDDLGLTLPNILKKVRKYGLEEFLNIRIGFDLKKLGYDFTIPVINIGNIHLPEQKITIGEKTQADVPNGDQSATFLTIVYTSSLYLLMVGIDFYISSHMEHLLQVPSIRESSNDRDCEDISRKEWRNCNKRIDCIYDKGVNGRGCTTIFS